MEFIKKKMSNRETGGALILTLLCITLLSVVTMGMASISLKQGRISSSHYKATQLLYLARAGISRARLKLALDENWAKTEPYEENITIDNSTAQIKVEVTPAAGNSSNTYKIWTVTSTATLELGSRKVTAILEKETFARYAMFTDDMGWLYEYGNSHDLYSGPVHSNKYFLFYGKPEFSSPITSSNLSDDYYDPQNGKYEQGGDITIDPSLFYHYWISYSNDKPVAAEGTNNFYFAGGQPPKFMPSGISDEQKDNAAIFIEVVDPDIPEITFLNSGQMQIKVGLETTVKSSESVTVYASGDVKVRGTIKGNVTIVSEDRIIITDNLIYDNKTLDTLALVAKNDIHLNTDTDDVRDIEIDAMLFSLRGGFAADDWNVEPPRGTINLFGGLVQKKQYATGVYSWFEGRLVSGYKKNFTFDPRFLTRPPDNVPTTGKIRIKAWLDDAAL